MKQYFTFVKKEFAHVLRDRRTLFILFGMPVVQILIFGFALTNEIKNTSIAVLDLAKNQTSQQFIARVDASQYFELDKTLNHAAQIESVFKEGKIKMVLVIPSDFQHQLVHQNKSPLQVITDATDPNTANLIATYVSGITIDYQAQITGQTTGAYAITPQIKMLYNPQLKGAPNFVPGVIALVLMLVCVMMTAISIVREKETGTMEILLVSPFKPVLVILSKATPYLFLSLVNVASILLLSVYALDLPVNGSLLLLFAESTLFIITCLSLGIFISVRTNSQQVAMLISLMGMLLPTMIFSGFMFPIENMPLPLQMVSNVVPSKWFYIIVKSIMIKGLGFSAIWKETLVLVGITLFFFVVSIKNFKVRLA